MSRLVGNKNMKKEKVEEKIEEKAPYVLKALDAKKDKACVCGHEKKHHYEGPRGWCNVKECVCQEHQ